MKGYPISGINQITLTPEQQELRHKMRQQEEEQEKLWQQEQAQQQAERLYNQVKFVLDSIQGHPFVQQILSIRGGNDDKERYTRIALEALIRNHPDMDPKEIAKRAGMIGVEIAKNFA